MHNVSWELPAESAASAKEANGFEGCAYAKCKGNYTGGGQFDLTTRAYPPCIPNAYVAPCDGQIAATSATAGTCTCRANYTGGGAFSTADNTYPACSPNAFTASCSQGTVAATSAAVQHGKAGR